MIYDNANDIVDELFKKLRNNNGKELILFLI